MRAYAEDVVIAVIECEQACTRYIAHVDIVFLLFAIPVLQASCCLPVAQKVFCHLKLVPKSTFLSTMLDAVDALYAPRGGIDLLGKSGYVDCFRALYPDTDGYTFPAPMHTGRIDFIFASSALAPQLTAAGVIVEGEGVAADQASDHLPILAEFRTASTERVNNETKDEYT